MHQLLSDSLWPTLQTLSSGGGLKLAAVSYATSDEYVQFGCDDILIVDASDSAVEQGQTDAHLLEEAFERGAEVYSYPGLHSKLMVLNGHAVVGSANLSVSSAESLVEVALVSNQPSIVGMAIFIIHELKEAADLIDEAFLERIKQIEVKARIGGSIARKPRLTESFQPRTWLVGVRETDKDFPDEEKAIKQGEAVAKQALDGPDNRPDELSFAGKSRIRTEARAGDYIIPVVWSGENSDTPSKVYRHTPILHKQEGVRRTFLFVEQLSNHEDTAIGWDKFQVLAERIGVPGRLGPNSARQLKDSQADELLRRWEE